MRHLFPASLLAPLRVRHRLRKAVWSPFHHGYRRAVLRHPSGGSLSPTNDLVVAADIWAAVQQRCEGRTVSATHNCAKTRQPPLPCLIPRAWPRSHRHGPLAIGRQPRGPRVHLRCASRHRTLLLLLMSLNRIKRPGLNQQNKRISQCERQAMSVRPQRRLSSWDRGSLGPLSRLCSSSHQVMGSGPWCWPAPPVGPKTRGLGAHSAGVQSTLCPSLETKTKGDTCLCG